LEEKIVVRELRSYGDRAPNRRSYAAVNADPNHFALHWSRWRIPATFLRQAEGIAYCGHQKKPAMRL
jgi:hypothetical protein